MRVGLRLPVVLQVASTQLALHRPPEPVPSQQQRKPPYPPREPGGGAGKRRPRGGGQFSFPLPASPLWKPLSGTPLRIRKLPKGGGFSGAPSTRRNPDKTPRRRLPARKEGRRGATGQWNGAGHPAPPRPLESERGKCPGRPPSGAPLARLPDTVIRVRLAVRKKRRFEKFVRMRNKFGFSLRNRRKR